MANAPLDCCKELLAALRQQNLVPWRTVYRRQVTTDPAATQERLDIPLKRSERTAGFVAVLKNRDTLSGAADTWLQYSFQDAMDAAQSYTELGLGNGLYLAPGQSVVQPLPGWAESVTLDLRGADAADPSDPLETVAIVIVYELVPIQYPEAC